MAKGNKSKKAVGKTPVATKGTNEVRDRLRQRLAAFSDSEKEASVVPSEDHKAEQSQGDADDDDESYKEEEGDTDTEGEDGTDDDEAEEEAEEEADPPAVIRARTKRATKKARTAAKPAVTLTKKRSSSRATDPEDIVDRVVARMEQGKSRTAGGDPAKGKAVPKTAEEYLTDGVMETARLRCTQRLAKKTMYPNLDMATTVAAAVLRDELPGVDVPPSVVTKLAGKVQDAPTFMFGLGGSFCAMQMLYIMRHDVRSKYGIRTKQALKAPGNYREVPPQQHDDLLKDAHYRKGPDGGEYSDPRFLHVLAHTYFPNGPPEEEAMTLSAAEVAFAELAIYWLVLKNNPTFPPDNSAGQDGRKKYEEFLKAAAEKGINEKHLKVAAKKVPGEKEQPAKKKKTAPAKKDKQRRES